MKSDSSTTQRKVIVVYDKECPACDHYCNVIRIRESVGELVLVDARVDSDLMQEITMGGFDIDQGMIVKIDEQLFYGPDAIHALSLLSSRSGVFNRLNYRMFQSKRVSKVLYPVLKFFRNMLLKFLRVSKINNLNFNDNDRF